MQRGMRNAAKLRLPSNLVKLNAQFEFVVKLHGKFVVVVVYFHVMNLLTVCRLQGSSVF